MAIFILEKPLTRWSINIFFGVMFKFILDVTYSLIYRNYPLFQPIKNYLFAILIALITLELIYQVNKLLDRRMEWEKGPYRRFLAQWIYSVGIAFVVVTGLRWLLKIGFSTFYYVRVLDEIIIAILVIIVISILVMADLSMFLLDKWRFSLAELERFKKENAEFQFEALRSQVNPHFLFNTLNTLSSLIYENKEKAELFIRELTDVYRYILEHRGKELVSLEKEMTVAKSYIFLIQLRFGENLNVKITNEGSFNRWSIAPLTLQILIENTVKHNVISSRKPLSVAIDLENGYLTVKNNLQRKESKEYSSGLGLKNISSRYAFLTDKKVEVKEDGNEFLVKIPLIKSV